MTRHTGAAVNGGPDRSGLQSDDGGRRASVIGAHDFARPDSRWQGVIPRNAGELDREVERRGWKAVRILRLAQTKLAAGAVIRVRNRMRGQRTMARNDVQREEQTLQP